jgi:adenylate cyclase
LGRAAFRTGDNASAAAWARRAIASAERSSNVEGDGGEAATALAHAYNTLGVALARGGATQEAVEHIERSLSVAQRHNVAQVACRAQINLGVLYSALDPQRAIDTCLAGLALAKRIGDLGSQSWLYANLACAYCTFTGQCEDEGIVAAQTAIELDRQLELRDHLAVPLIVLGQIYQCYGKSDRAQACFNEALALAEELNDPQLRFPCYEGLAALYLEAGDTRRAEDLLLKAQRICTENDLDSASLTVLPFLC